jgi:hypothetical protein
MMLRSPRPTIRGIQQVIDSGTIRKVDVNPNGWLTFRLWTSMKNPGLSMLSIKNDPDRLPSPIITRPDSIRVSLSPTGVRLSLSCLIR